MNLNGFSSFKITSFSFRSGIKEENRLVCLHYNANVISIEFIHVICVFPGPDKEVKNNLCAPVSLYQDTIQTPSAEADFFIFLSDKNGREKIKRKKGV